MEDIIIVEPIDIKGLILTIRGKQVLLDSDVAMLYGYETKQI
ncbi:MAG: ORF6N domain-containing protein, partial [Clostridiales Family XIII bacterium]|nr:ORF6N domain-containing protein [Clostridiales Family XIII bacterium]